MNSRLMTEIVFLKYERADVSRHSRRFAAVRSRLMMAMLVGFCLDQTTLPAYVSDAKYRLRPLCRSARDLTA